jgi:hypothetical protein
MYFQNRGLPSAIQAIAVSRFFVLALASAIHSTACRRLGLNPRRSPGLPVSLRAG